MPHDANGTALTAGDEVTLRCRVREICGASPTACNVTLEALDPPPPIDEYRPTITCNSRSVLKLDRPAIPTEKPPRADLFTHKPDGTPRHPGTVGVLRHFRFAHLPAALQAFSRPACDLAMHMADTLPEGPDLTCGLRELLAAKDNFVRARMN